MATANPPSTEDHLLPALQHLTHLTLDCQHVGETQNQDAVAVILAAAPNLKALNLRKCRQLSIDIVGSLVRACPRLVCFTISGMNDLRQPVYHDYTRFPAEHTNLILQQLRSYSSTLEKIHIGRWWYGWFSHGSPRSKDDLISFRGLPNLRVVSVHCWTLYQDKRNTSDALVDMVKDCPKLECLELVEADWGIPPEMVLKALVTFKRFLGKGGSRFPHLKRISLVCWTPDKVRKWASPFLFKSVGVDVVYTDQRQWLDNWIRVVETEGKQII